MMETSVLDSFGYIARHGGKGGALCSDGNLCSRLFLELTS